MTESGSNSSETTGVSPYATGGGGTEFEFRVAARYLARLLTRWVVPEAGNTFKLVSVGFQQSQNPVDDLLLNTRSASGIEKAVLVTVRRSPNIVRSNTDTQKLFLQLVKASLANDLTDHGPDLCLVVAGYKRDCDELAKLTVHAASKTDAEQFFESVHLPKSFKRQVRNRLDHVRDLVRTCLEKFGYEDMSDPSVHHQTWRLLSRMTVQMPRLEMSNPSDWDDLVNELVPVSISEEGLPLRDRLHSLASDWSSKGAVIDLNLLRIHLHDFLDLTETRDKQAWKTLNHLHSEAVDKVKAQLGPTQDDGGFQLDRDTVASELLECSAPLVIVHGESGVGKSALTLQTFTDAAETDTSIEIVCLNLRHVDQQTSGFTHKLDISLKQTLGELSAERQIVVVDAADAVLEGWADAFMYVLRSALDNEIQVFAVTSDIACDHLEQLTSSLNSAVEQFHVGELLEDEINAVVEAFPNLRRLTHNERSRHLLRRLAIVDLLVRIGDSSSLFSEAAAMQKVWATLVKTHDNGKGTAMARELALLRLADMSLRNETNVLALDTLDAEALDGLLADGILIETSQSFGLGIEFVHDQLRYYAIAKLFLNGESIDSQLEKYGTPRWAVPATLLACQSSLDKDTDSLDCFRKLQDSFNVIADENSDRWRDVPSEALLGVADPSAALGQIWPGLDSATAEGMVRIALQRFSNSYGGVLPFAAEPLIEQLLKKSTWQEKENVRLLKGWLLSRIASKTPAGHYLRCQLKEALLTHHQQKAERTGVEPSWRNEIMDETTLELLGSLGADIGDDGESEIRKLAKEFPSYLAPVVETAAAVMGLAVYSPALLAEVSKAYYIEDSGTYGVGSEGVRRHDPRRKPPFTLNSWDFGPFLVLAQTDPLLGVSLVNTMLNHAVKVRTELSTAAQNDCSDHAIKLSIDGDSRTFLGDEHSWLWYRGTSVGPYPCMSALQAIEVFAEQLIEQGQPLDLVVELMLRDCANNAMASLIAGMLIRHLDKAEDLLDPFLVEPKVWDFETQRLIHETSGLAARPQGITNTKLRQCHLQDVVMMQVLHADEARASELKHLGERLVENTEGQIVPSLSDEERQQLEVRLLQMRATAHRFDKSTYKTHKTEDGVAIESVLPEELFQELSAVSAEGETDTKIYHLMTQYRHDRRSPSEYESEQLNEDLRTVQTIMETTHDNQFFGEAVTALAARTVEANLAGVSVDVANLAFAVDVLVEVGLSCYQVDGDNESSYYPSGATRNAARALPLLMSDSALEFVSNIAEISETAPDIYPAIINLAQSPIYETRLYLSRAVDPLWAEPCADAECPHGDLIKTLLKPVLYSTVFNPLNSETERRGFRTINDIGDLVSTDARDIYWPGLDAAIRACGAAAASKSCISIQARQALLVLVPAQQRALLASDDVVVDDRGTHNLVTARELLRLAATDPKPLFDHLTRYKEDGELLRVFLHSLSAAAEETLPLAATAAKVWPEIIDRVIGFYEAGDIQVDRHSSYDSPLEAVIPHERGENQYLYPENEPTQIVWWEPQKWGRQLEKWVALSIGRPQAIDAITHALKPLPNNTQIEIGLPILEKLTSQNAEEIVQRSYFIEPWLEETQQAAADDNHLTLWQNLVDRLTAAGSNLLARHSD